MARPWFRMYRGVLGSPKIQRLKPDLFKAWVNILCCTDDDGNIPNVSDLAFLLRVNDAKALEYLVILAKAGLIDKVEGGFVAHDWEHHQFQSDTDPTARDRKRRQRERSRSVTRDTSVTGSDGHKQGHAKDTRTDTDTDTDTDTEKRESDARENNRPANRSRTPWPPDAVVPDVWITTAAQQRRLAGLPEIDLHVAARMFANHYAADTQNPRTMTEYQAKWNNWALKEKAANGTRTHGKSQLEQLADIIAADQGVNG